MIRSSWHLAPIDGIGLEWGMPGCSPCCKRLRRNPASTLAPWDKGGVFTSPWNQTSGLSFNFPRENYMPNMTYCQHAGEQHNLTPSWSARRMLLSKTPPLNSTVSRDTKSRDRMCLEWRFCLSGRTLGVSPPMPYAGVLAVRCAVGAKPRGQCTELGP